MPGRAARVRLLLRLTACAAITGATRSSSSTSRPSPGAFTKPVASKALGALLDEKRVQMVTDFNAERIDAAARKIIGYDGREIPYDLLVTVPTNMGSEMIERSGLGNEFRFLPTDPHTLRSKNIREHLRHRRRDRPAHVEGRLRRPFPGRDPGRERPPGDRGQAARAGLRRPLELLHRVRPAQGHPDRLQLRGRAAARALPLPGRRARCRSSSRAASTTGASSPSAGSTGTSSCRGGRSRSSRPG